LRRWVVTLDPILKDGVGRVAIGGIWPVEVYMLDADHRYCELIDLDVGCGSGSVGSCTGSLGSGSGNNVVLASAHAGSGKIIWHDEIIDDYAWAYVQYPVEVPQMFRATDEIDESTWQIPGQPVLRCGDVVDFNNDTVAAQFDVMCTPQITCDNCDDQCQYQDTLNLTVGGFSDPDDVLNGAYVLTHVGGSGGCFWSTDGTGGAGPETATMECSGGDWLLTVGETGSGQATATIATGTRDCAIGPYDLETAGDSGVGIVTYG